MMTDIKPLTAEAFAKYGDVIEVDSKEPIGINYGYTERFHDLANIDATAEGGRAGVSIFRSQPLPMPISIKIMERHPLSSQAFVPLSNEPYLVVVAPAGEFDESRIEVFLAQPGQGVNYAAGTWHHFCLALNKPSNFLVVDRIGKGHNCDEVELKEQKSIIV
jgi:ureidoglycolate lyase